MSNMTRRWRRQWMIERKLHIQLTYKPRPHKYNVITTFEHTPCNSLFQRAKALAMRLYRRRTTQG